MIKQIWKTITYLAHPLVSLLIASAEAFPYPLNTISFPQQHRRWFEGSACTAPSEGLLTLTICARAIFHLNYSM